MQEIPDELSLGFSVLGCNVHCPHCHSKHTWDIFSKGEGIPLTYEEVKQAIEKQKYMTCVLFFGGEWEQDYLLNLLKQIKNEFNLKTALYSGRDLKHFFHSPLCDVLDFLKVGSYIKSLGSLIYPSTNQRLYKLKGGNIEKDLTPLFWKTRIK